ncbi:MAG: RidA family protein [Erysipelotrichaceae bacterium]
MFTKAITSANAPKAIGPYSPAVKLGDFVYVSGTLPVDPTTNEMVSTDIKEQTHQVLKNMSNLLAEMNLELRHVVKTTVFVTDLKDFNDMNEVYATYFSEPFPARSCVQVAALPRDSKIEIEALVIDTLAYEAQMQGGCDGGCGCHDAEETSGCSQNDEGCCCGK